MGFDDVAAVVRDRVEPSPAEREALAEAVETLLTRVEAAVADLDVPATVTHVGSTARDTWLRGERDIDVFVEFPTNLSRGALEQYGLQIGHEVLPEGREEYAEHPYVTGDIDGFAVDLVPCYAVPSAHAIESAVDRTPFHSAYLKERLTPEHVAEIRVFKQFLQAICVYGSNLRTQGFSGYLTELLVLEFGSTKAVLEAAVDWQPPVVIDPEDHGERSFPDPLVVIDPTDPTRNVAAVLSAENLARFQHHARDILANPRVAAFFPAPPEPLSVADVEAHITARGTTPLALVFPTPDLVDDELYPQLRKSLDGIGDELDRRGFDVLRQSVFADTRAVLLFELAVPTRPRVTRHLGPPVAVRKHAETFYDTYADEDAYGPFIDGNRYVVERAREFDTARAFLESDALFETRLGPAIEAALREDATILEGQEVTELADAFGVAFARYFAPSP